MNIREAMGAPESTPIHDALAEGVDVLGQNQTVDFTPYVRVVLPLDGFVFWINASLLSPAQLAAAGVAGATPAPVTVQGSLHYSSTGSQVEDETIVVRRVDFTAEQQITAFAEIANSVMYVGTWETPLGAFRFTFSQRGTYYVQANIHHYVGDAIYPVFAAQLIDDISTFDQRQVVSNSLPIWLAMLGAVPIFQGITISVPLYPAFLAPTNLEPPYGTVDITGTRALQTTPWRDSDGSSWLLAAERVRLVLYGLRNNEAYDLLDYICDYSVATDLYGVMNMPSVTDDRRSQVELAAIAQKKTIDLEISYHQNRMRALSRALIETVVPTLYVSDDPIIPEPAPIIEIRP